MNLIERMRSDWVYLSGFMRIVSHMDKIAAEPNATLADAIEAMTTAHADRTFIEFDNERWTYGEYEARANQYARWGASIGLIAGDALALFMENRPDYLAAWFGMTKIGVRTALINSNLSGASLAHCIKAASARAVLLNPELAPAYASAKDQAPVDLGVWSLGPAAGAEDVTPALRRMMDTRPEAELRKGVVSSDVALFIYTSGTTGLPKAAKITHSRARGLMRAFVDAVQVKGEDRIFLTLPLYHATGGMCGVGCAINTGATLILKRKFSASHFWQNAIESRANMLVYIGELGRYLMNLPPSTLERSHAFVKGFGNGLRADVWAEFVKRTGITHLVEFYGSTEGNVNFFNLDGKIGAVGRIPPLMRKQIKARLVKFDVDREIPLRGMDGFCIEADIDEPGEAIGPITGEARYRFDGYNDEKQTEKKLLRNVFAKDDLWFRTGDLMRMDKDGYVYFVDRIGDTYRWKSENVSTGEVEMALGVLPWIEHAVVYGVAVPGYDGRAGMAAITPRGGPDLSGLYTQMVSALPGYARPIFVRFRRDVETTGTLKYRKVDLVADGFDPSKTEDPIYVADVEAGGYAPLDSAMYDRIVRGQFRI